MILKTRFSAEEISGAGRFPVFTTSLVVMHLLCVNLAALPRISAFWVSPVQVFDRLRQRQWSSGVNGHRRASGYSIRFYTQWFTFEQRCVRNLFARSPPSRLNPPSTNHGSPQTQQPHTMSSPAFVEGWPTSDPFEDIRRYRTEISLQVSSVQHPIGQFSSLRLFFRFLSTCCRLTLIYPGRPWRDVPCSVWNACSGFVIVRGGFRVPAKRPSHHFSPPIIGS